MGRRIISSLLAMALIFSLPVFSFADGEEVSVKDSGSPEVSLMALRSIAADEGISLAAAEGDSGQFGYNIEPYQGDYIISISETTNRYNYIIEFPLLPAGSYSFSADFSLAMRDSTHSYYVWVYDSSSFLDHWGGSGLTHADWTFEISEPTHLSLQATFPLDSDIAQLSMSNFTSSVLFPVEGISSGYTYSSGILERSTRSIFESFDADFGSQPAGKYLVNIYHWGDSYDVRFQISDSTESYYLPTSTNGSVTTLVYNHPGGQFTLDGSFTASNDETSVVDGSLSGAGMGEYFQLLGELGADGPLSWVFNIKDIVAIPYDQAADHNFGFFAPIIGFFRDQFSDMKSWIAVQIDKIAGDDETKADVDQAQDSLNKEVEELGQLSTDLTTQTGNLEQQFTTDFAIPSEVLGQTGAVQQIYNFLFSSLGIFSIFIWLPVVLAVIKKLLRL